MKPTSRDARPSVNGRWLRLRPRSGGDAGAVAVDILAHLLVESPDYPSALQNAVVTAVQNDPIHIWLYTNPRIFAYSPTVTGIPSDLVQQRWEGVQVAG